MARFSLSFISIFLVLAVLTLSMPTKRDEQPASQPFSLQGTVSGLVQRKEDKKAATKEEAKKEEAKAYAKMDAKKAASDNPAPTLTTKLSSGNFVTPTATATHKPTSEPNALGSLPLIGGLLGGAGGGL
ncbi:hypothetical protein N7453_006413 [Penicillium expansum]|nr:hypothetical protein N7453_006413 [Penicillium expansum]